MATIAMQSDQGIVGATGLSDLDEKLEATSQI